MPNHAAFNWKFHRIGGLDQVTLRTPEELLHLNELDPKLWVALSCPIDKLQFDARTLELLDADKDGRIRIQEVLDAVRWTVDRLSDPALLAESRPELSLEEIRQDTDEGRLLYSTASRILTQSGKEGALTQEDVAEAIDAATPTAFNGDGVLTPHPSFAPEMNRFIEDIVATTGGATDAGGQQGATLELAQTFMRNIQDYKAWFDELAAYADTFPLGSGTDTAFQIFQSVRPKIDDYFTRCQLVAFDVRASDALNAPETIFAQLVDHALNTDDEAMRELPLAHIAADQPLPLEKGLNPAWRDQIIALKDTIAVPLLGVRDELTSDKWQTIKTRFAPYAELVARKPENGVEKLGMERLGELLSSDLPSRFEALTQQDEDAAGHLKTLTDVERLVLYHHHLHRLLMNFGSFCDFYALSRPTTFQIGLCSSTAEVAIRLRVDDITNHAAQAQPSHLCLAYCECSHLDTGQKMNIVAAVTAGDSNLLIPGRHGVFGHKARAGKPFWSSWWITPSVSVQHVRALQTVRAHDHRPARKARVVQRFSAHVRRLKSIDKLTADARRKPSRSTSGGAWGSSRLSARPRRHRHGARQHRGGVVLSGMVAVPPAVRGDLPVHIRPLHVPRVAEAAAQDARSCP
ncbi:MAG: hypothetical protein ACLSAH_07210 [Bilophila wadsworthia]